jgi:integrase
MGERRANGPAPAPKEEPSMQSKATPGITERHARTCAAKTARARETGARCTCAPSFEAWVWVAHQGKKKRRTFPTRAAAKGWLVDARRDAKHGKLRVGDDKITVSAWLTRWLDERASQDASPRVVGLYRQSVETHVVPTIGHMRLVNLRRADCNELVSELFRKGLARNTIKRTVTPLRLALDVAVDEEKIAANPAASLDIPKKAPTRKLHVPTLAEVNRILEKATEDGRDAIVFVASLGLRRSEMLALRWCDVDFEHNLVHVRRKNVGGIIEEGSKTDAGERTIPLYATARATLEARATRLGFQAQWLAADERLIFANARGGPFEPTNWYRRVWKTARDAAGDDLADVRLHDLRHFNVTALRELGMEGKLRTVITGHTDTRTTERIYDHVREEHIEAAAAKYDPLAG